MPVHVFASYCDFYEKEYGEVSAKGDSTDHEDDVAHMDTNESYSTEEEASDCVQTDTTEQEDYESVDCGEWTSGSEDELSINSDTVGMMSDSTD